jgi:diadenosine tetraphosphatase ApaH/serine/threonine PP2A family protein phosphatase
VFKLSPVSFPVLKLHPASQIIDGTVLCVHGGLSPDIRTLDQIRVLPRAQEIPHEGAFCGLSAFPPLSVIHSHSLVADLMWSDPDEVENWAVSPRGAGWLFGGSVTQEVRCSSLPVVHSPSFTAFTFFVCHSYSSTTSIPSP